MSDPRALVSWAGVAWLFAAMLGGLALLTEGEMRAYRSEGLTASATVVDKRRFRNPGNDTTDHELHVTYMRKESAEPRATAHVDLLEGTFELGTIDMGSFQRATVDVGGATYRDVDVGDTVEIVYRPSRPDEARMAEAVERWSALPLRLVTAALAAVGAGLMVLALGVRLRTGSWGPSERAGEAKSGSDPTS